MRPISTGYSSISAGSEEYIKEIVEPLLKKCTFLVNSQNSFKKRFLVEKQKFDENLHQLVCFDIKQMYPSVNITRVVSYILKVIFKNPKSYFTPEKDAKGYTLPIPTREEFKLLLLAVLKDFNYFDSQVGIFKQLKGIQMGSKLALLISNLFYRLLGNGGRQKTNKIRISRQLDPLR